MTYVYVCICVCIIDKEKQGEEVNYSMNNVATWKLEMDRLADKIQKWLLDSKYSQQPYHIIFQNFIQVCIYVKFINLAFLFSSFVSTSSLS